MPLDTLDNAFLDKHFTHQAHFRRLQKWLLQNNTWREMLVHTEHPSITTTLSMQPAPLAILKSALKESDFEELFPDDINFSILFDWLETRKEYQAMGPWWTPIEDLQNPNPKYTDDHLFTPPLAPKNRAPITDKGPMITPHKPPSLPTQYSSSSSDSPPSPNTSPVTAHVAQCILDCAMANENADKITPPTPHLPAARPTNRPPSDTPIAIHEPTNNRVKTTVPPLQTIARDPINASRLITTSEIPHKIAEHEQMDRLHTLAQAASTSLSAPIAPSTEPPLEPDQQLYFDETLDIMPTPLTITKAKTPRPQPSITTKAQTKARATNKKRRLNNKRLAEDSSYTEVLPDPQTTRSGRLTTIPKDIYQPTQPQRGCRPNTNLLDPDQQETATRSDTLTFYQSVEYDSGNDSMTSSMEKPNNRTNLNDFHDPGLTGFIYAKRELRRLYDRLRWQRKTQKTEAFTKSEETHRREMAHHMVYGPYNLKSSMISAINDERDLIIQDIKNSTLAHPLTYCEMSRRLLAPVYLLDHDDDYYGPNGSMTLYLARQKEMEEDSATEETSHNQDKTTEISQDILEEEGKMEG